MILYPTILQKFGRGSYSTIYINTKIYNYLYICNYFMCVIYKDAGCLYYFSINRYIILKIYIHKEFFNKMFCNFISNLIRLCFIKVNFVCLHFCTLNWNLFPLKRRTTNTRISFRNLVNIYILIVAYFPQYTIGLLLFSICFYWRTTKTFYTEQSSTTSVWLFVTKAITIQIKKVFPHRKIAWECNLLKA